MSQDFGRASEEHVAAFFYFQLPVAEAARLLDAGPPYAQCSTAHSCSVPRILLVEGPPDNHPPNLRCPGADLVQFGARSGVSNVQVF